MIDLEGRTFFGRHIPDHPREKRPPAINLELRFSSRENRLLVNEGKGGTSVEWDPDINSLTIRVGEKDQRIRYTGTVIEGLGGVNFIRGRYASPAYGKGEFRTREL